MTPKFESLPVEVQEVVRDVYETILCLIGICKIDNWVGGPLHIDLCKQRNQIEALWPEFGEGKEASCGTTR